MSQKVETGAHSTSVLLAARFVDLATRLSVSPTIAASAAKAIISAYTGPQRFYHTLDHISHMLSGLDSLPNSFADRVATELAIFYHDVVYDPVKGAPWNEEESIRVWKALVEASRPALDHLEVAVAALIHATISHKLLTSCPPSLAMEDISAFLNLDIAILATPRERYQLYSTSIRKEYIHVPIEDYQTGRAKVLSGFLSRDKLFLGSGMEVQEALARTNLTEEIEGLRSGRLP